MNWEVRTMRSGTSCFNGTLYRKTMARFWPLWALYGLFWMFAIPLNLMNRYFNYLRWTGGTGTPQDLLLDLARSIPESLAPGVWLAALMGLLCAMACFGYLYNNRSACMMHALPMRRETLFVTQYLAGLSFLLLPVAAVALCGVLVELARRPPSMWAAARPCLAVWFLAHSGACLFFFSFAAFCAMFTGHILALPVFYGVLNGLALGVYALIQSLLDQFYYGFFFQDPSGGPVYYLTPLYALIEANGHIYDPHSRSIDDPLLVAIYAGAGVVLAVLALLIYRGRQVESAGDVVSIPLVRPLFQIGVAFCAGLSLGLFTALFFGCYEDPLALTLCALIWTAVGFFVAEMLLKKSFRVLGAWKRCLAMTAAMAALCLVCFLDPFGIEARTPQAGEVASVRLSLESGYPYDSGRLSGLELTDPQHVQQVIDLHKAIIRDKDRLEDNIGNSGYVSLDYTLTDGTRLTRRYSQVFLYKAEEHTEGTLTWQVGQLISDRGLVTQAYGFDQAEQGTLMETYLRSVYDTRKQSYTDLSMDDYGQQLWQAVKADFDAGNIGKRYLFDDEERSENTYATDLYFLWGRLNKYGEQEDFYRSVTVTLTPQAANTLAVLESTGLLGNDYQLQPHSRDSGHGDYVDGGWDRSGSETVSIEPDEPAMDDFDPSYGVIGGADGPTVIVSGTAITG